MGFQGPQILLWDQILTGQTISRLGTVLRVPVNVQEGDRLEYKNVYIGDDLFW